MDNLWKVWRLYIEYSSKVQEIENIWYNQLSFIKVIKTCLRHIFDSYRFYIVFEVWSAYIRSTNLNHSIVCQKRHVTRQALSTNHAHEMRIVHWCMYDPFKLIRSFTNPCFLSSAILMICCFLSLITTVLQLCSITFALQTSVGDC